MIIPQNIIDGIVEQAFAGLPEEVCGLLVGRENEVVERYPLTNIDHSPEHFSFDPKEQFQVLRKARSQGLRIIANYHSHPETPARPSDEDIRLAYDPDIAYFILSLQDKENPVLKAFSIKNGKTEEIELVLNNVLKK
ncbi:MAG: M67 family metallopeptidase [Prevotellaceae bacterium]|jgi:proteasome lid subunit RPN8/RPN11|nr:M67 family metallopeptidase [Prevotellaceae bacterium]